MHGNDVMVALFSEEIQRKLGNWGPFLESPGNLTGPKSNIQIEI